MEPILLTDESPYNFLSANTRRKIEEIISKDRIRVAAGEAHIGSYTVPDPHFQETPADLAYFVYKNLPPHLKETIKTFENYLELWDSMSTQFIPQASIPRERRADVLEYDSFLSDEYHGLAHKELKIR